MSPLQNKHTHTHSLTHKHTDGECIVNGVPESFETETMRVRVRAWVALDDVDLIRETTLPPPSSSFFAGRFVKVDPCVGLTEDDASAAIAMLRAGAEQQQHNHKKSGDEPVRGSTRRVRTNLGIF